MENQDIDADYINKVKRLIGSWIKAFRKEKGITQRELGKRLGVSEATVSRIESGVLISLNILIKLSVLLDFYLFLLEKDSNDELAKMMQDRWRRAHEEN